MMEYYYLDGVDRIIDVCEKHNLSIQQIADLCEYLGKLGDYGKFDTIMFYAKVLSEFCV